MFCNGEFFSSFDLQTFRNDNIIPEYCIHVFLAWSNLEICKKTMFSFQMTFLLLSSSSLLKLLYTY